MSYLQVARELPVVQLYSGNFFLKKMGQSRPLFCLFSFFSDYNFNNSNWKSLDGVA